MNPQRGLDEDTRRVHLVMPGAERTLCGKVLAAKLRPTQFHLGMCELCRAAAKKLKHGPARQLPKRRKLGRYW